MKKILLAFAAFIPTLAMGQIAPVANPDFSMFSNSEKKVIGKNANVKAYVATLGGKTFKVTQGKPGPLLYGIETNNGCSFDVEVVYKKWPVIEDIVVYQNAVCKK